MVKGKSAKMVMIFTIISTAITLVSIGFNLLTPQEASSIGIIGGADGPTAIYIAGRLSPHIFTGIFGFFSVVGMVYLFFTKRLRK